MDRIFHTLQINLSVAKPDLIFLRNKPLYCFGSILFVVPNRLINILWYKTLTYFFDINRPHMFTIKIEWFNNWTLSWKAHLYYNFKHWRGHSLHFAQNYPSSVSKTLQSWCRALKAFYQTFLLLLCNVFCHVYERSLKLLETNNISFVSKHELNLSKKFFHSHLQMDRYW